MRLNNDPIRHQDVTAAVLEFSSSTLSLPLLKSLCVLLELLPYISGSFYDSLFSLQITSPSPSSSISLPTAPLLPLLSDFFLFFFLPYSSPLPLVLMYPCHFLLALFFLTLSSHLLLYLRCFHSKKKEKKKKRE